MIKNNKFSLGTWITLPSNDIAEILSKAGFDWIAVDLEHSAITESQAQDLIRVINLSGKESLVRLKSNSEDQIKKVLDMGAHGIIVPNVKSISDIDHAYKSMKYPPNGKRGIGLARAQGYGNNFSSYLQWQKSNTKLIIQIENKHALSNLDEIFSSKKIYSFIIGPYDLSGSLGVAGKFESPIFKNAIKKIIKKADKYKIKKGIHIIEPNIKNLKKAIKQDYKFIAYSLDIRMIDTKAREINSLKKNINVK